CLAGRIDRPIQVRPPACDPDVGLVDAPGAIGAANLPTNPLIQHRRIALDPAPDRDMIDGHTPLRYDLLQVAIGEGISQVPPNAKENDHVFKMPPAEQCWPSSVHRYTLPNGLAPHLQQSPPGRMMSFRAITLTRTPTLSAPAGHRPTQLRRYPSSPRAPAPV